MGMKRATNFATAGPRPVARIAGLLWLVGIGFLFSTVWSVQQFLQSQEALIQTQDHIDRITDQVARLAQEADNAPNAQALTEQAQRVAFYNDLTGPRSAGISDVLSLLEAALPNDVWVSQLSYSVETGRLSLSILTDVETALPPALRALEEREGLTGVILDRQVRLTQGGRQLLQYDVKAEVF